jgi:nucleoside-diphosphate-sugar epimerase
MSNILITGGAGFMGRWIAKRLIEEKHRVWILDNLSNSTEDNIAEFRHNLAGFIRADIKDRRELAKIFTQGFDICLHLAAAINVQDSIDNPENCFNNNVAGFFNVLEECRKYNTKMVFISSALIYATAKEGEKITEGHPLNPSCPYTVSKIFGENLTRSYYKTYNLPVVILRPFSIYGPWQRSDSEGGVMSIFIERKLKGRPIEVFGDGEQSRDFFYVEDCVDFILKAAFSEAAVGEIFNAGSGEETKIKDLAKMITEDRTAIRFVEHAHPHAEVKSMRADSTKTERILDWKVKTTLEEGINRTRNWLKIQQESPLTVDK